MEYEKSLRTRKNRSKKTEDIIRVDYTNHSQHRGIDTDCIDDIVF